MKSRNIYLSMTAEELKQVAKSATSLASRLDIDLDIKFKNFINTCYESANLRASKKC